MLFLSGREIGYIRNRVLLAALQEYCEVTVLTGSGHNMITRLLGGLLKWRINQPEYDVVLAGFYGQPIAIAMAFLQHQPVILDAYVSTYDTLCEDRKIFHPQSIMGRLAYWIDQNSCRLSHVVLTDTWANARYFHHRFGVPYRKLKVIYVGCDESIFYPQPGVITSSSPCNVFYYGSFLPLHGVEVIIQAAALLKERRDIQFILGGNGPLIKFIKRMIEEMDLKNVSMVGWIPLEQLPSYIARSTICLGGHFSTIPKASRVISTKTFQFIAMRKPTIVGDNEATRELFVHGEHVYMVPMGDHVALADAIQVLASDNALRDHIASGGYSIFQKRLRISIIANELIRIIEEIRG